MLCERKKKEKKGAGIYLMIFGELRDQAVFARWQKNFVRGTTRLPATDLGILYQVDGITQRTVHGMRRKV